MDKPNVAHRAMPEDEVVVFELGLWMSCSCLESLGEKNASTLIWSGDVLMLHLRDGCH